MFRCLRTNKNGQGSGSTGPAANTTKFVHSPQPSCPSKAGRRRSNHKVVAAKDLCCRFEALHSRGVTVSHAAQPSAPPHGYNAASLFGLRSIPGNCAGLQTRNTEDATGGVDRRTKGEDGASDGSAELHTNSATTAPACDRRML